MQLEDKEGRQVTVRSVQPFHFDAHHSRVADYQAAGHDHELIKREETIVHIDAAHGPIGGDMAWSTAMPEKFQVAGGDYHLKIAIKAENK